MEELISVVVACYNIKEYITRCLESLVAQSYRNIEIICVDDGSTDGSSDICDKIAEKDERVIVFHNQNMGLSDARNFGLSMCSGNYITFIDGDDWVDSNYIEMLFRYLKENKSDISIVNFYIDTGTEKKPFYSGSNEFVFDAKHALLELFYQKKYDVSAWGKLYKKSLFNDVKYPSGKLYEDNGTTYKIFMKAKKVSFCNKPAYHYFVRHDSITHRAFNPNKIDGFVLSSQMIKDIEIYDKTIISAAVCKHLSVCFDLFMQCNGLEPYSSQLFREIKKYRFKVIFNKKSRLKNKIACMISYFGEKVSLKLLRLMKGK